MSLYIAPFPVKEGLNFLLDQLPSLFLSEKNRFNLQSAFASLAQDLESSLFGFEIDPSEGWVDFAYSEEQKHPHIPILWKCFDIGSSHGKRIEPNYYMRMAHPYLQERKIAQMAWMKGRNASAIRFCIQAEEHCLPHLGHPGLTREARQLLGHLRPYFSSRFLNVDFDPQKGILPRVGFEWGIHKGSVAEVKRRWPEVISLCCDAGLIHSQQRDALISWFGYDLIDEDPVTFLIRDVGHIKFVYEPDQKLRAKFYIGGFCVKRTQSSRIPLMGN